MSCTTSNAGTIPEPSKTIKDFSAEHEEISDTEKEKNTLQAELIREKICRDVQRKEHRSIVFTAVTVVCFSFYCIFISLMAYVYSDISILKNVPVLWVAPLLALVTVPTILLVMVILSIYRKSAEEMPSGALRLLESLSRVAK